MIRIKSGVSCLKFRALASQEPASPAYSLPEEEFLPGTFVESEGARGQMWPQDDFLNINTHMICHFRVFCVAESISAILEVVSSNGTDSCPNLCQGRQNCLNIPISKNSNVICLFVGFWVR